MGNWLAIKSRGRHRNVLFLGFSICEIFASASGVIFSARSASLAITACANSPVTLPFPTKQTAVVAAGNVTIHLGARGYFPGKNLPDKQRLFPPLSHWACTLKSNVGHSRTSVLFSAKVSCCWHMSTPIGTCLVPEEAQGPLNIKKKYRISIKANACRAVWDTDWNLTSDEVRKLREKRARLDRKAGWLHLYWLMIPENLQCAASILAQLFFFKGCLLVGCFERKRVGQTSLPDRSWMWVWFHVLCERWSFHVATLRLICGESESCES